MPGVQQEQTSVRRRRSYFLAAGGVVVVALLVLCYTLFVGGSSASNQNSPTLSGGGQQQLTTQQLYDQTVQRAYAIDKLFRQVYTPGWQGANGAIGDAYLYAVTGDQSLLYSFTNIHKLTDIINGTWVDDRMWACLAEMYWWNFTGRTNGTWVEDAKQRYLEAKREGRFGHPEGFWSWYDWPVKTVPVPNGKKGETTVAQDVPNDVVFTNTNMDLMASVACWLYEATGDKQFYDDAILLWDGDAKYPGIEKPFYKGNGIWEAKQGPTFVGGQFPWMAAGCASIGASLYKMTGNPKYKEIAVATAKRIMDPANGWIDGQDFYQIRMDGNGAFVNFIVDAYEIAPDELSDVPMKIGKMLEHVWTNHHGTATVTLHRYSDDAIRNGWSPNGGEIGYGVDEVGTVHAQSQAVRAFGVYAYVLKQELNKERAQKEATKADSSK
jgi:hypothetical protein